MAKRLILLFLVLLLIPFISSAPPVTTIQHFPEGIVIETSPQQYLKQGEDHTVNFFVYNSSTGKLIDNSSTTCDFYMDNDTGELVVSENVLYNENDYWDFKINGGNFSEAGQYQYGIKCQSTTSGGTTVGAWEVTYNGISLSTSQSILYGFFFLVFVFFMVSIIFIINALPASNTQDEEGKILSISYLKYFRSSLWFVEWMLLIGLLYISSNVAFAYLPEQLFAQVLFVLFRITFLLTPVILVVWIIWIFVKMFHDKQLQKLLNKGFFPQGKI